MRLFKPYLLVIFMLYLTTLLYGNEDEHIHFKHITVDDGLSNNSAICFNQDTLGLMWIGTNDGLNMYNSAEFQVFRYRKDDATSLSNNRVKSIVFDDKNNLWVGTEEGLNLFISNTSRFKRFYCDSSEKKELFTNNINTLFPYNDKIFLGTDKGLKILDTAKNSFIHFPVIGLDGPDIKNVAAIMKDSRNNIWVGTESGLLYYNKNFKLITTFPGIDKIAWGNSIVEDSRKNIWVCTNNGVYKITNKNTGNYKYYPSVKNQITTKNTSYSGCAEDENSNLWLASGAGLHMVDNQDNWTNFTAGRAYGNLNDNYIRSVFFDRQGNMWVGTDAGGINLYYKHRKKFKYLSVYQEEGKRLLSNKTKGVYADSKGMIWVGAEGLNMFNPNTERVKTWSEITKIISITEDYGNRIWVTTERGIYRLNQKNGQIKHFPMDSEVPGSDYVHDIHVDKTGKILAATWGGGLWVFKPSVNRFQPVIDINKHEKLAHLKYLYEDRKGKLWAGNDAGIFQLDKEYNPVFSLTNNTERELQLNGSYTYCMYQDIEGNYWIGTNRGLQCYNPDKKKISSFGRKNGFRNEVILGILEDRENNFWLTTYSGLVKLSRLDSSVRVFTSRDGLISNQFSQGSVAISPVDQTFYLGSIEGLVYFDPLQLESNTIAPAVIFTDFRVFNKSINPVDNNSLLEKHITHTNTIALPYKYSVFSFKYIGIHYGASEAVEYEYKLEGFDGNWRSVGTTRSATYTNLKPGHYTFKVKAANEDDMWSEEACMNIRVLYPWWLKWYSFLAYAIILLGLLLFARKIILTRHKLNHKVKIQELEHEQENKLNDLKIQFFTSLSHEFKTPLTLISGPLETLMLSTDKNSDNCKQLNLIKSNVNRLLGLVNQLLEFRKIEKGKMQLNASENDIVLFTKKIVDVFADFALEKGIRFNFNSEKESHFVYIDPAKIETIIYNLLMNAIKYNSFQGEIDINIKEQSITNGEKVFVSITDHGIGISKEDTKKIFERFYQAPKSNILGGTGIGLALAKEFARLHGGDLTVESEENVYTSFTLMLFKGKHHLDPSSINEDKLDLDNYRFQQPHLDIGASKKFRSDNVKKEHTIALVEDNDDIRSYIKNLLSFDYNIIEYRDGKEAFEDIIINIPNLIITDIMMPVMDGFELCENLKNEIRTCHIPVIMLTAKDFMESQLKGIETGADAYITKPFSNLHLKTTIKNLIQSRKKIGYRYSIDYNDQDIRHTSLSNDDVFLKRFYAYIDQNISNPELDINTIIEHFQISRVQLYRKLKSQTNLSANKIIKTHRLQKAKELLLANNMNISEIAYAVGFTDSLYFSKCFKEKFKVSPSHYLKKNHK